MSDPKFVPPLRFDLFRLIETGELMPLDLCVYGYLVAHSPNWQPVPLDIAKRLNVSHRTATRAMQRLWRAGLMSKGRGSKVPEKVKHPEVMRIGVWTGNTQSSSATEVTHDMSSVTQPRSDKETELKDLKYLGESPEVDQKSLMTSVGSESRSVTVALPTKANHKFTYAMSRDGMPWCYPCGGYHDEKD